jgi:hypothetical protein
MHFSFFRWPEGSKHVFFLKRPPGAMCKTSPL